MKDIINIIILIPFCLLGFGYIVGFFAIISDNKDEKETLNPVNFFKHDKFSDSIVDLLLTILKWVTIGYMIYLLLTPFLVILKITNK